MEIADKMFNKKYLPLLKQMYMIGFNDGFSKQMEVMLYGGK